MHILSARNPRRDERGWDCDATVLVLQLQVARREEVAFFEDPGVRAAGGGFGLFAVAGTDVDECSLGTVEARVGQGRERGYADADETGCDFCLTPQEDLRLVPCYVWALARSDADDEAHDAECGGPVRIG